MVHLVVSVIAGRRWMRGIERVSPRKHERELGALDRTGVLAGHRRFLTGRAERFADGRAGLGSVMATERIRGHVEVLARLRISAAIPAGVARCAEPVEDGPSAIVRLALGGCDHRRAVIVTGMCHRHVRGGKDDAGAQRAGCKKLDAEHVGASSIETHGSV
ncbi:MAG TPA: hypothetical protein VFT22_19605 [Kofleriaceae bacterium]|nr:hypothetical protein [Kofleriaceae bacterium]